MNAELLIDRRVINLNKWFRFTLVDLSLCSGVTFLDDPSSLQFDFEATVRVNGAIDLRNNLRGAIPQFFMHLRISLSYMLTENGVLLLSSAGGLTFQISLN